MTGEIKLIEKTEVQESFNKLSSESFKEKKAKLKEWNEKKLKTLKTKYLKDKAKCKNTHDKKALWDKYHQAKKIQINQYSLRYNHLQNQLLYRWTMFNRMKFQLKTKYKKKIKAKPAEKDKLKKELKQKINAARKKYSTPLSLRYLAKQSDKKHLKQNVNLSKIHVPIDSPNKKLIKSLLLIILTAILTTFALDMFIKPFGIYSAGLRGITQTIFYVIQHYDHSVSTSISHVLFFGMNIPLAIFGYIKLGKRTTILTLIFVGLQYLTSLTFDLTNLDAYVQPFGESTTAIMAEKDSSFYHVSIPYISAMIGAIMYGAGVALAYKAGASSGGSKFIVSYIAAKRNKGIGSIAFLFSLFVMAQGLIVNHILVDGDNFIETFTSTILFASIIYAFVSNITLDKVFPRNKKSEIILLTKKKDDIIAFLELFLIQGTSFTVSQAKVGAKEEARHKIVFVVMKREEHILTTVFSQIDKDAIMTINSVEKSYGKIFNKWFE